MFEGNVSAAEKAASALAGGAMGEFQYAAELWFRFGAADRAPSSQPTAADNKARKPATSASKYTPFILSDAKEHPYHELVLFARRSLQLNDGLVHESVLTLDDHSDDSVAGFHGGGGAAMDAMTVHRREWFVSRAASTLAGRMSCRPLIQRPWSTARCLDVDMALGRDNDGQWQKQMRIFELDTTARARGALRQIDNIQSAPQKLQVGRILVLELEVSPKASTEAPTIVTYVGVSTDGLARAHFEGRLGEYRIQVRNATSLVSAASVCTFYAHEGDDRKACRERVTNALRRDYWEMRAEHVQEFQQRYRQTALRWSPSDDFARKLLHMYNLGRYLALSGTHPQAQPMNLQG